MVGKFIGAYREVSHFKTLNYYIIEPESALAEAIGLMCAELAKIAEGKVALKGVKLCLKISRVGVKVACDNNVFLILAEVGYCRKLWLSRRLLRMRL